MDIHEMLSDLRPLAREFSKEECLSMLTEKEQLILEEAKRAFDKKEALADLMGLDVNWRMLDKVSRAKAEEEFVAKWPYGGLFGESQAAVDELRALDDIYTRGYPLIIWLATGRGPKPSVS